MFDRAVALSGQLHLEGLGVNFPAYHQLMSSFAAAQQSFAPTLPYSSYAYENACQPNSMSNVTLSHQLLIVLLHFFHLGVSNVLDYG